MKYVLFSENSIMISNCMHFIVVKAISVPNANNEQTLHFIVVTKGVTSLHHPEIV